LRPDYLKITQQIILKHIDTKNYSVFLFGSRACGNAKSYSDIDIGISGNKALSSIIKANIENELDESIVPYKVDIVDFLRVSEDFKKYAFKKIVKWN
jgi:predicted nucleotidyltransferase